MKKFEIPVKSKKMALQAGGFAQGIHLSSNWFGLERLSTRHRRDALH